MFKTDNSWINFKTCERCGRESDEWMNVKYDDDYNYLETVCLDCELPDDDSLTNFLRNELYAMDSYIDDGMREFDEHIINITDHKGWSIDNTDILPTHLRKTLFDWIHTEAHGGNDNVYMYNLIWKRLNGEKVVSRADRFDKLECDCGKTAQWFDNVEEVYYCDECKGEVV